MRQINPGLFFKSIKNGGGNMAVDMSLKIDGVDGESLLAGHEDEIDVLAWSWGASQSGSMHTGLGGGSGKVSVQDISVTKWIDKASFALFRLVATGEHFDSAVLSVRKAGGKEPVEYLEIALKKVIITSYSTGGSGGEDRLTENITLNFEEFEFTYTPQNEDGSKGDKLPFKFNIAQNKEQ
jgi:type VI secretion system secreted protein Hcp